MIREQKHRLYRFCRQILMALGGEPSAVDSTLSHVLNSDFPPRIASLTDHSVTKVNPYSVEVDSISPEYAHDFFCTEGIVRDEYFRAKQELHYAMMDVEEIVYAYERVIEKTDPRELVMAFEDELSEMYPFWNASFGRAREAIDRIGYLEASLNDLDELRNRLQQTGKLEWATALVDSVYELEPEIKSYLGDVNKESFSLCWRIETVDGLGRLQLLYEGDRCQDGDTFCTTHSKGVELRTRYRSRTRAITVKDVTEEVQYRLRKHLDGLLDSSEAQH